MRLDLSPLYRTAIGFDRFANLAETAMSNNANGGYPPYNIERVAEHAYRITMAVAGFTIDDIEITTEQGNLLVTGCLNREDTQREFLYQGIAERNFERRFQLADHVKVKGANMDSGLLHIDLEREIPESMKPRKIAINATVSDNSNKLTSKTQASAA